MRPLTLIQVLVLSKVIEHNGTVANTVGNDCGIHYQSATAWAHSKLLGLEKRGLIERRSETDLYFTATQEGLMEYENRKKDLVAAGDYVPNRKKFSNEIV